MHGTGSGSCPMTGFGFSYVETCGSATTVLVMSKMLSNCYVKDKQSTSKTSVNVTTMLYSRSSLSVVIYPSNNWKFGS